MRRRSGDHGGLLACTGIHGYVWCLRMNGLGLDRWNLDLTETNLSVVRFILDGFPVTFSPLLLDDRDHFSTSMFNHDSRSMNEFLVEIVRNLRFEADRPGLPDEFAGIHAEFLGFSFQSFGCGWCVSLSFGMTDGPVTDRTKREVPRANLCDPGEFD